MLSATSQRKLRASRLHSYVGYKTESDKRDKHKLMDTDSRLGVTRGKGAAGREAGPGLTRTVTEGAGLTRNSAPPRARETAGCRPAAKAGSAGRPRRLPRARGCLCRARATRLPATHLRGRPRPRERTPPSFCLWASDSPAWGRGLSLQLRPAAADASPPVSSKRRATAPRAPRRVFRNIPGAGSRPGAPASQRP